MGISERIAMNTLFDKEKVTSFFGKEKKAVNSLWRWCIAAGILGVGMGFTGVAFHNLLGMVTQLRTAFPMMVFGLPFAGLLIVFMYKKAGGDAEKGTNLVLSAIQTGKKLPFRMAPLIFAGTILTHMFGGSSGREGAALQIGGSIGNSMGRLLKLDDKDKNILIMCGMSACFSAMFGTPAAAAVFSLEVVSVGVMYYAALLPCVLSAVIARGISKAMGVEAIRFTLSDIASIDLLSGMKLIALGAIFAAASILFILALNYINGGFKKYIKNPYIKIFIAGWAIVGLSFIFGQQYLGNGSNLIGQSMLESVPWYFFLLKMLFTSITLGGGYKGGEIIPSLCIGATIGSCMAPVFGMPVALCAACGMVSVFCGVTNSPITSILLAVELFGVSSLYYCLISISVSYLLSEYFSLYKSQKIMYSKYEATFINRKTH